MRVYHYLPAKWAFRDLKHQRLKLAVLTDLNDPFDLLCYDLRNREMRQPFKATRDELASRTGMLCFSRTWKNPVTDSWPVLLSMHRLVTRNALASWDSHSTRPRSRRLVEVPPD